MFITLEALIFLDIVEVSVFKKNNFQPKKPTLHCNKPAYHSQKS